MRTHDERTRRRCAGASKPEPSSAWRGTASRPVASQVDAANAKPTTTSAIAVPGGRLKSSHPDVISSIDIAGSTIGVIRSEWRRWYSTNPSAPTDSKSG